MGVLTKNLKEGLRIKGRAFTNRVTRHIRVVGRRIKRELLSHLSSGDLVSRVLVAFCATAWSRAASLAFFAIGARIKP